MATTIMGSEPASSGATGTAVPTSPVCGAPLPDGDAEDASGSGAGAGGGGVLGGGGLDIGGAGAAQSPSPARHGGTNVLSQGSPPPEAGTLSIQDRVEKPAFAAGSHAAVHGLHSPTQSTAGPTGAGGGGVAAGGVGGGRAAAPDWSTLIVNAPLLDALWPRTTAA